MLKQSILLALVLPMMSAGVCRADESPIVPLGVELCPETDHPDVLSCLGAWYSDIQVETVPLSLDTGIWSPGAGGIFATVQRHNRGEEGTEIAVEDISPENLSKLIAEGDPANAYRVLSADQTANNLVISLTLLADEIFATAPQDASVAYLILTKTIESTLFRAAVEDKRAIYTATEQFRNCVYLTLIDQKTERLQDAGLTNLASSVAEIVPDE